MAFYRVEVAWRTKREAICDGMIVKAFGPDEAEEYAREKVTKGHPARKIAYVTIEEADPAYAEARGFYDSNTSGTRRRAESAL